MINKNYKPETPRRFLGLKSISLPKLPWYLLGAGVLIAGGLFVIITHEAGTLHTQEQNQDTSSPSVETAPALPDAGAAATAAAEPAEAYIRNTVTVEKGDTLAKIFNQINLSPQLLHTLISRKEAEPLRRIMPGEELQFTLTDDQDLVELVYQTSLTHSLKIYNDNGTYQFLEDIRTPEIRTAYAAGVIDSSLYAAGQAAGMSDALIMELANIFGWDIDFALDIRENDAFNLLYEDKFLDGRKIGTGAILAASFTNDGRTFEAVRYTDPEGNTNYYTPDGKSMRKAFLRSPVDFTRISSGFGKRFHPILNRMRAHNGVDYAAATGTPVKSTGDGRIVFKGVKGGYGNTLIVQHGSQYQTLYAHLSGYKKGLKNGSTVSQGQVIGYIGSSGLATGPHLHYEFRVNGAHRNPLTIRFPDAEPIEAKHLAHFMAVTQPLLAQLNLMSKTRLAQNEF
ncbi:MAG: peptidoglycan DD-metalloendopeptidase family protein [Pseudomonadota bacterium]